MATDFTYDGKQIVIGGPIKPNGKDMPSDARTRVDCYADIATIPNPYVGLRITVKVDETNNNKMTDYIVKSLKADSIEMANMLIDEVVRYVDYLRVNTSGSSGEGLTSEQSQQLTVAYSHSQSTHVSFDDLLNIDAISLNGKKFSEPMTKVEYDAITSKDENTIYLVTDENEGVGTGTGLTKEQTQQLQIAYEHSQTTHAPFVAEANVQADWNETDTTSDAYIKNKPTSLNGDVVLTSPNGTEYKLVVSDNGVLSAEEIAPSVYGEIISSTDSLSIIEGGRGTFNITLSQAPTKDQIINISVDNTDITLNPTSVTFSSSNYNTAQAVSVIVAEDSDYINETAIITLSSAKVSNVTINVSITDNDEETVINSITAVYTQGDTAIYPSTSLNSLKNNLVVTANYSDSTSHVATDYTLDGTLTVGTSTITVTYQGKTTTFDVTVSEDPAANLDRAYSYLKVIVPPDATSEQSTLYLSKPVGTTMSELYINDVSSTVPTGANQVTTSYTLNEGENIIKIKGNFTCWNSKCNINVIQLQKDLTTCRGMCYGCSDLVFSATIPSTVTDTIGMFQSSSISKSPTIPDGVLDTSDMFKRSLLVTAPTVPNSVQRCSSMYESCDRLQGTVNVSSSATNLQKYLSSAGINGTGIILTGINTDIVTNYLLAFNFSKIITIDQSFADLLTNPKPSNVTNAICFNKNNKNLSTPITIDEVHSDWKQ